MKGCVVYKKRLTLHKGTSHKFYTMKVLKYISVRGLKYAIITEYGRLGGYATKRSKSVKGYTKIAITSINIKNLLKAKKEVNDTVKKQKKKGYK